MFQEIILIGVIVILIAIHFLDRWHRKYAERRAFIETVESFARIGLHVPPKDQERYRQLTGRNLDT